MAVKTAFGAMVPSLGDQPNVPVDITVAANTAIAFAGRPAFTTTALRDKAYSDAGITLITGMRCSVDGVRQKYVNTAWINQGVRQFNEANGYSGGGIAPNSAINLTVLTLSNVLKGSTVEVDFGAMLNMPAGGGNAGMLSCVLAGPQSSNAGRSVRWHSHGIGGFYLVGGRVSLTATASGQFQALVSSTGENNSASAVQVMEMPMYIREIV